VEHGYVTERLNVVFGFNWDFEIVDKQILDDEVIVEARLTVRTPGKQTIVKTQFGGAEIKRHTSGATSGRPVSIADDYKAAASDALKKCASLLGIGLDLYGRDRTDDTVPQPTDASAVTVPEQSSPEVVETAVRTFSAPEPGMCRADQAAEIEALADRLGMGLSELAQSLHVGSVTELTESRAQRVLNRLRELSGGLESELAS
jgi:hypothetical protein